MLTWVTAFVAAVALLAFLGLTGMMLVKFGAVVTVQNSNFDRWMGRLFLWFVIAAILAFAIPWLSSLS